MRVSSSCLRETLAAEAEHRERDVRIGRVAVLGHAVMSRIFESTDSKRVLESRWVTAAAIAARWRWFDVIDGLMRVYLLKEKIVRCSTSRRRRPSRSLRSGSTVGALATMTVRSMVWVRAQKPIDIEMS